MPQSNESDTTTHSLTTQPALAIDPGKAKCGIAVVDSGLHTLQRNVVPISDLETELFQWVERFHPGVLLMGDGTGAQEFLKRIEAMNLPLSVQFVDEKHTSEEARARYVREVPPAGINRLIPRLLRYPETPYDDFVAVILAERWWNNHPLVDE